MLKNSLSGKYFHQNLPFPTTYFQKYSIFGLLILAIVFFNFGSVSAQDTTRSPIIVNGRLARFANFKSEFVIPRNVDVWLPTNYSHKKKYEVLYMQDGQMLFDSSTTWNKQAWDVDNIILKLGSENKLRDFILVAVWNTKLRHSEYIPEKPFLSLNSTEKQRVTDAGKKIANRVLEEGKPISDLYLKFLVTELKPFIDRTFSTKKGLKHTFISGSSKGGLISLYAICEYPKIFGAAACLSTDWPVIFTNENTPMPKALQNYIAQKAPNPRNHKLYFDFGTKTLDSLYEKHQLKVDSILIGKGFKNKNFKSLKFEGKSHTERDWRGRFDIPLLFLLGK